MINPSHDIIESNKFINLHYLIKLRNQKTLVIQDMSRLMVVHYRNLWTKKRIGPR